MTKTRRTYNNDAFDDYLHDVLQTEMLQVLFSTILMHNLTPKQKQMLQELKQKRTN